MKLGFNQFNITQEVLKLYQTEHIARLLTVLDYVT